MKYIYIYVFKHVWNSEQDTIREMKKQLNYASSFLMTFKFNGERATFCLYSNKSEQSKTSL